MTDNIQGKVIVITGASSGNGEAAARHLADRGRPSSSARAARTGSKPWRGS
jgi:NADP-dependent 3-hydroxy acid dehydrogenase YdfG